MLNISGDLVSQFESLTATTVQAFLPLLVAVVSLFIAFAIGRQLKTFIMRMVSKR